jgi:cell wall-associated NlpC family hydrolase
MLQPGLYLEDRAIYICFFSIFMNPRNLLFLVIAISSAALGASIAVTMRLRPMPLQTLQPAQVQSAQVQSTQSQPAQILAQTGSSSTTLLPPPTSEASTVTPATIPTALAPASTPIGAAPVTAASTTAEEFNQIKTQLRRAIHERNSVLLRSLLQASSLRDALGAVAAEPVNFDNLDASAWKVLEKAIDYRCHHRTASTPTPELCLMHPVAQPAQ